MNCDGVHHYGQGSDDIFMSCFVLKTTNAKPCCLSLPYFT